MTFHCIAIIKDNVSRFDIARKIWFHEKGCFKQSNMPPIINRPFCCVKIISKMLHDWGPLCYIIRTVQSLTLDTINQIKFCATPWWLEMEGWSQAILAQNRGGWPAANESRTSDSKATRQGQIGMAATCGNGYVFDKLLKKKKNSLVVKQSIVNSCMHLYLRLHFLCLWTVSYDCLRGFSLFYSLRVYRASA